jgi:hypothetical protein
MAKVYLECWSNGEDEEGAGAFDQLRRALGRCRAARANSFAGWISENDEFLRHCRREKPVHNRLSLGYDITALVLVAR